MHKDYEDINGCKNFTPISHASDPGPKYPDRTTTPFDLM